MKEQVVLSVSGSVAVAGAAASRLLPEESRPKFVLQRIVRLGAPVYFHKRRARNGCYVEQRGRIR